MTSFGRLWGVRFWHQFDNPKVVHLTTLFFEWWLCAEQATNHHLDQWWPNLQTHICITWSQWVNSRHFCFNFYQYGFALNMRQTIIWTNGGLIYWRIDVSHGLNGLLTADIFFFIFLWLLSFEVWRTEQRQAAQNYLFGIIRVLTRTCLCRVKYKRENAISRDDCVSFTSTQQTNTSGHVECRRKLDVLSNKDPISASFLRMLSK